MILTIDVGNSQLFGGIFKDGEIVFRFRKVSTQGASSDEIGVFLRNVLRENGFAADDIRDIGCCSVVPEINHSLTNACLKYFNKEPFFLKAGVKTGLRIKYTDPKQVGADRIANAVSAAKRFPGRNLIVVDFGTATTYDVITENKEYLGGAIIAGIKTSMKTLEANTARLPSVEIVTPDRICGNTTVSSIQSGLYYSQLGTAKEMIKGLTRECFNGEKPTVVATGGFARLFMDSGVFDELVPDLVLEGLYYAMEINR